MLMLRTCSLSFVALLWGGCTGDPVEGNPSSGGSTASVGDEDGGGPQTVTTVGSADEGGSADATSGKGDGTPTTSADDVTGGDSIGSGSATSTSGGASSSDSNTSGVATESTGTGSDESSGAASGGTTSGSGGSGSSTDPMTSTTGEPACPPSMDACGGCLGEFCCSELLACNEDTQCACWRECIAAGGLPMQCNNTCNGQSSLFNELRDCVQDNCAGDCSL